MDFTTALTPELQQFLLNVSANALGSLAAKAAPRLIGAAGRSVRGLFAADERTAALSRAAGQAILAAVKDTPARPDAYADLWERYGDWLLEPVVVGEFRKLLTPSPATSPPSASASSRPRGVRRRRGRLCCWGRWGRKPTKPRIQVARIG